MLSVLLVVIVFMRINILYFFFYVLMLSPCENNIDILFLCVLKTYLLVNQWLFKNVLCSEVFWGQTSWKDIEMKALSLDH